jgi:hypothetical protein
LVAITAVGNLSVCKTPIKILKEQAPLREVKNSIAQWIPHQSKFERQKQKIKELPLKTRETKFLIAHAVGKEFDTKIKNIK